MINRRSIPTSARPSVGRGSFPTTVPVRSAPGSDHEVSPMRRLVSLATVAVLAAVVVAVVAGTGGGARQPAAVAAPSAGAVPPTVALRRSGLGSILVDARGRTLYLFEADHAGMSACSGACAAVWPPLATSGDPGAGAGVQPAGLGTIGRGGGARQVTYGGHPLYAYAGDTRPGATAGQGLDQFGAKWYVLDAAGHKVDRD